MSQTDLLAEAKSLRSLVESEAAATDSDLTLTKPVFEAFEKKGLWHMNVPRDFGGFETDTDTTLDVFEELSHQDGSIGWTQMANAAATAYAAFLDPSAAATMVKDRPSSVFAGQFAPRGTVKREGDAFRVGGNYSFGSGSGHASYLGGGAMLMADASMPEMLANGMPAYTCFFVPKSGAELQGGWDVLGLRGTGSYDYEVKDQLVEAGMTFFLFDAQVRTGGPFYGIGPTQLAGLGHAGWGLGVAQRALDEIQKIAEGGRVRLGQPSLQDQQVFQREFAQKSLALQSVRLLVHDMFGNAVRHLETGAPLDKSWNDKLMSSVAYMTEVAEEAALFAYRSAGSQGLRNPSRVQECFRDMMTGGRHLFVDKKSYEEFTRSTLGIQG
jgi:alkylation response protein AidB-like acyl-CoA dehydrogenase